jgi:hypothetical protein
MKGKRFTDEQIAYALRQAEGGTPGGGLPKVIRLVLRRQKTKRGATWPG